MGELERDVSAPRKAIRPGSWSSSRNAVLVSRCSSPGCRGVAAWLRRRPRSAAPRALGQLPDSLFRAHEPRRAHDRSRSQLPGTPSPGRQDGISEGPFELYQFGPGDMRVAITPRPCIRRRQSASSAAPTSTLFGSQPRNAHVPPYGSSSTTATRHRLSGTVRRADPAVPVPITMRSRVLAWASVQVEPTTAS